jgi:hypothetical protein
LWLSSSSLFCLRVWVRSQLALRLELQIFLAQIKLNALGLVIVAVRIKMGLKGMQKKDDDPSDCLCEARS